MMGLYMDTGKEIEAIIVGLFKPKLEAVPAVMKSLQTGAVKSPVEFCMAASQTWTDVRSTIFLPKLHISYTCRA